MSAGWRDSSSASGLRRDCTVPPTRGRSARPMNISGSIRRSSRVWFGVGANHHAWQNEIPGEREWALHPPEDACGFWDGTLWAPGDSRLIPDHHLQMPAPDAMLFDFSDSDWHFGLAGAVKMANAYPTTPLLLHHWGSVAAPDFPPFNRDPEVLYGLVINPERIRILAPGELYVAGEEHGAQRGRGVPAAVLADRQRHRDAGGGRVDREDRSARRAPQDRDRQDRLPRKGTGI